ncbi:hypothetical protein O1611_g3910 [Lasiodiplodia mahajangana]|uniref:Uncharacterized protein n=1 Tax=Lasiodiplodia mahajangana TaxID=1108764 RepID=A0ACC2JQF6_9PEZI|nr:hypothetical protein O1611_g3910 [Lasiodiplodia mahajangana]
MHFLLCLAVAGLVSADAFSINAYMPGHLTLDGEVLHASNYGFSTGLEGPSTYCPPNIGAACPTVAGTLVSRGMEAMAVIVPGGQQIYVQADGRVKYSIPHSAYIPPDAIVGGWYHKTVASSAETAMINDVIDFDDSHGNKGLVFCLSDDGRGFGKYALYAKTEKFNANACTDLQDVSGLVLTKSAAGVGCWQYA